MTAVAVASPPPNATNATAAPLALDSVRAELARRSLAWFFRSSWHVLEPMTPLVWNWHLQATCDHVQALLEGRLANRNLLVNIPPGSSKSRIVMVCTTPWMWLHNPAWRAIYASGNPDVALRDSMLARDLIESQWYQETFRPDWRLADDQNAKGHYKNTATGERRALSTGAKVTGNRGHGLFVDDAIDAKEAHSKAAREHAITWYRLAFANRLSDPQTGTRCVIEQRLHGGDLSGYLLEHEPRNWEHLCIRQEYEQPKEGTPKHTTALGWSDPRTRDGELMDPVRFPEHVLAEERTRLASAGYAGQHQQRPTSAEGNIIKREWFKFYKSKDAAGEPVVPRQLIAMLGLQRLVQGWDTALTEKQSSDYSAGCTIGVAQAKYYVLDLYKKRSEFPEVKKAIITNHAKWGANAVPVEAKSSASGKVAVQELRRETRVPVIEVAAIDKVVGLNKVAPSIEAGCVYLPEDADWVEDFIESVCTFPMAVHDDDVDAFRIALDYAISGGSGMGMFEWMRNRANAAPLRPR
jgi:predicted phage terminase large subunit-like protein